MGHSPTPTFIPLLHNSVVPIQRFNLYFIIDSLVYIPCNKWNPFKYKKNLFALLISLQPVKDCRMNKKCGDGNTWIALCLSEYFCDNVAIIQLTIADGNFLIF